VKNTPRGVPAPRGALVAACLIVLVAAVFGRVAGHPFIVFDDPSYVTDNSLVQHGLTAAGLRWALTTSDYFYWHPLTWLSHMLDCQLFGLNPAGHHITNLVIHAATVLLVFAAFVSMTGFLGRSALVAAVFAIHPLNVEPVAWVAERKELLAGFFWFSTILVYAWYARRPSWRRYALVAAGCVCGLMSKPVVVTLPLALLLLDVWPLARMSRATAARLVAEKVPLAALAIGASVLTYVGQQRAGAMVLMAHVSPGERLRHAIVAYEMYLREFFWPQSLAVLYPYPAQHPLTLVITAAAALLAITIVVAIFARRAPFALVGWCWFVGTLVPMIGLVQVGAQAHADRFMYIPAVGLSLAVVWGAAQALERRPPWIGRALAAGCVAALAIAASAQTRYWVNSVTLMQRTVAVTADNPIALHLLAYSLAVDGRLSEAVPYYRASLRLAPRNPLAWYNLGLALAALQQPVEAVRSIDAALRLAPSYGEAHYSLGSILMEQHDLADARTEFEAALRLPLSSEAAADASRRLRQLDRLVRRP
jgi:tetratricopeptide (TPR) repeat protein